MDRSWPTSALASRRGLLAGTAAATALTAFPGNASAAPAVSAASTVDTAVAWYDVTAAAIATGTRPQVVSSRAWAIAWLAAARALRTAPPGAVLPGAASTGAVLPGAASTGAGDFGDAALASAVHETLRALLPDSAAALDAALATALARIPTGSAKERGVAAGQHAARALIAARTGDGLEAASVNPAFPTPAPAPGIWQPTPPALTPGQQAGTRFATPFLLARADQYRPGPPPALGSARYAADLAEVRAYGAVDSAVRTEEQLHTALFWYGSSLTLYTGILRAALAQSRQPLAWRASLVALFHVALVDTQIATSDSKYAYLRWRPVTAIRATDDPLWTPVHVTPAHPDYPSGHNTYSGAAEQVLTTLVGPRARTPYTIDSPSQPGATRTYTTWRKPTDENIDARVWSGIHTRTADEVGAQLGRAVAAHTLRHTPHLFP